MFFQRKLVFRSHDFEQKISSLGKGRIARRMSNGDAEDQTESKFQKYLPIFDNALDGLIEEIVGEDERNPELEDAAQWLRKVLKYNVIGGKKNRGVMSILCLDYLRNGQMTDEELNQAVVVGWCIEWLQAFFLVADDIMDQSEMRRGHPCWYKLPEVGLIAVNDAFLINSCLYKLMRNHFSDCPFYVKLFDLFNEITHCTALGQELDLLTSQKHDGIAFESFTIERYNSIVKYKTAHYSFYLPVAAALHMVGTDKKAFENAKSILIKMGEYFQIQDDVLDCYGDPAVTGKIGTDIQEGKCSWLIVNALKLASEEQLKLIKEHYGKNSDESVEIIKGIFNEMKLINIFNDYEESSYNILVELIELHSDTLPKEMFMEIMKKIYKRRK